MKQTIKGKLNKKSNTIVQLHKNSQTMHLILPTWWNDLDRERNMTVIERHNQYNVKYFKQITYITFILFFHHMTYFKVI